MNKGELTRRHDAVVEAISHVARQVGAQVSTEVKGLNPLSNQRPDIQIVFLGRLILTDVTISHSLTPAQVKIGRTATVSRQGTKNARYAGIASRLGAEPLNVSIDSCGGLANSALELVRAIGEEGERWSAGTWTSGIIERQLLGAIAVAVQRGNALAMLTGYTRSAGVQAAQADEETLEGK